MKSGMRDGRQERLLHCAKKEFAGSGYYSANISHIVQEAGIARGTFYHYFDNKLHVFETILDSFLQELRSCVRPISLGAEAPPPLIQIQENLTRVLNLVLREGDVTQILLHHASTPDRTLETRLNDFYSQVAGMIERSLNLGITMKLVRPCNARLTAYAVIGAVKEVVHQLTASPDKQPPVEEVVRQLMDFGMGGILAGPQDSLLETTQRAGRMNLSKGLLAEGSRRPI